MHKLSLSGPMYRARVTRSFVDRGMLLADMNLLSFDQRFNVPEVRP